MVKMSDVPEDKREFVKEIYKLLKERKIHPAGSFSPDSVFHATCFEPGTGGRCDICGTQIIRPSRRHPYSQNQHCRTKKHTMNSAIADTEEWNYFVEKLQEHYQKMAFDFEGFLALV